MNQQTKYVLSVLGSAVISLFIYTFLHESGHALVALSCGGTITNFVLGLNAHMSYEGANFTPVTLSILNAAGMLLPVLVLIFVALFYKRDYDNIFYRCYFGIYSIGVTFSIVAWVIVPIVYLLSTPPVGDDVANFIANSGIHPLIVMSAAIIIIVSLVGLLLSKGIIQSFLALAKQVNSSANNPAK
jgi:hypothetical protein